jgi:hypothetical protein
MKEFTEEKAEVTVYKDKHGDVQYFLIKDYERNGEAFTAYRKTSSGYQWIVQEGDEQEALDKTRQAIYGHEHYCASCDAGAECEKPHECADEEADRVCEDCQGKQIARQPPAAPLEAHLKRQ